MYGSWDVLKQFYPNIDINKIAVGIAKKLGIEEIEKKLGELELDTTIPYEESLKKFKQNKMSYKDLCKEISECYQ